MMTDPVYLTAEFPPMAGRIRERAEDFLVDEQPLYQPSGEGEHIYLFIEKRNLSTHHAARILAGHFGVPQRDIGFAGLKDKLAITRQHFSIHVPGKRLEDFPMLQHERMGVLWADHHTNKLRRGHLVGNRFSIKIRGVPPTAALPAHRVMGKLEKAGVPNRFGEQRFGYTGRNHLVGRALLAGDAQGVLDAVLAPLDGEAASRDTQHEARLLFARGDYAAALEGFSRELRAERRMLGVLVRGGSAEKAAKSIERDEETFYLSAFQSEIYNRVLDERLRDGTFDSFLAGDVAFKHDGGALFDITNDMHGGDEGAELTRRLAAFEISPSGPMWGARMKRAGGEVDQRETAALSATGITVEMLQNYDKRHAHRISGERRPLRIPMTDPDVEGGVDEHGSYIRLAFDLPRGAFATAVLREVMKVAEPVSSPAGHPAVATEDDAGGQSGGGPGRGPGGGAADEADSDS